MSEEEAPAVEAGSSSSTRSRPDFEHESLEEILFDVMGRLEDAEHQTLDGLEGKSGGADHPSE